MPIIKGFVDQIFEESDILIILTKENKRYSVSKNNTLGVIKSGDFVIFNGEELKLMWKYPIYNLKIL